MRLRWSEEELAVRNAFRGVGHQVKARASDFRKQGSLDRTMWTKVAEAGLFGLPVDPAYGGSGKGWWSFAASLEGLSSTAGDLGFLLSVIAHMGAVRILSEEGTEDQKRRFLPRLVSGSVAATATTERSGGSDVARIRAAAAETSGQLFLTGEKKHITNAPVADVFIILGRIPHLGEKRDITLFLLDRDSTGLSTGTPEDTLGNASSPTGDIVLKEVAITQASILGRPGEGLASLYRMLTLDRLLYALVAAGYLEPIIEASMRHACSRTSFGKLLAEHQYVQDKIVLMKVAMEQARFLAYAALDRMLAGDPDMLSMGSIAKLVGTEHLWTAAADFLHLQGHQGYMTGAATEILSDAAAVRIAGGTSEMQKINIFNQLKRQIDDLAASGLGQMEAAQ